MIPSEIKNIIFNYANNKCHTCNRICKIPFKLQGKFYYCNKACYEFLY